MPYSLERSLVARVLRLLLGALIVGVIYLVRVENVSLRASLAAPPPSTAPFALRPGDALTRTVLGVANLQGLNAPILAVLLTQDNCKGCDESAGVWTDAAVLLDRAFIDPVVLLTHSTGTPAEISYEQRNRWADRPIVRLPWSNLALLGVHRPEVIPMVIVVRRSDDRVLLTIPGSLTRMSPAALAGALMAAARAQ